VIFFGFVYNMGRRE